MLQYVLYHLQSGKRYLFYQLTKGKLCAFSVTCLLWTIRWFCCHMSCFSVLCLINSPCCVQLEAGILHLELDRLFSWNKQCTPILPCLLIVLCLGKCIHWRKRNDGLCWLWPTADFSDFPWLNCLAESHLNGSQSFKLSNKSYFFYLWFCCLI